MTTLDMDIATLEEALRKHPPTDFDVDVAEATLRAWVAEFETRRTASQEDHWRYEEACAALRILDEQRGGERRSARQILDDAETLAWRERRIAKVGAR